MGGAMGVACVAEMSAAQADLESHTSCDDLLKSRNRTSEQTESLALVPRLM
jgi:hypothetical protein